MSKKRFNQTKTPNFIIGFDETNNGFHLESSNPYKSERLLFITGYLMPNPGKANYGSEMYERKGKIFGKRNLDLALKRGRQYLGRHPNFLYTAFPKSLARETPLEILRANAIALLTFNFFLKYEIQPIETQIIIDGISKRNGTREMDPVNTSHFINKVLDAWFERARIPQLMHISKTYADKNTIAVRKADRTSYYLAAITFLGNNRNWPYRDRFVNLNQLERSCAEVSNSLV